MDRRGFGGLVTDGQWERLLASAVPRTFAEGQMLLRQGEVGGGIHLMVRGRAKVVSVRADGSCVPLAFRTCGEMLGESALAGAGRPRSATVTALSPTSTAFLPVERFQRLLAELGLEPVLWHSALMRQDEGDRIRMRQTALPAERRLPAALLHLASVMGEPIPAPVSDGGAPATRGCLLRISLAQREIAEFAGMSRTSVHNAYTSLRERGVIRTGRQYVAILDLAALEALSGENETV
ncbi:MULTISPECIES: Crp/Fnr family transcriptional regulator [Nocardiopsis]|uniref:Crp/Fnr family transcriptional regulator n=1 Tax=Nocardiopsis sinuspersici TaxID=501010 RepID=A0A1V3C1B7_9ACTN|nr:MULTISPECIES: Crp/Fnr family transcriptional regulator [Nocardiopsis]OOC54296.1 Crp/Fnr family transcriptional regulator [Nocardiopsis sinuspersici]